MRNREIVIVPEGYGRDASPVRKRFLITEWPTDTAERWGIRASLALTRGGIPIPESAISGGMEAIFYMGVNSLLAGKMDADEIIPIFDQLLECVKIVRDPKAVDAATGEPIATALVSSDDIEEVRTRLWLRSEVIRVHMGFSPADILRTWWGTIVLGMSALNSLDTQTSRPSSGPPSPVSVQ